MDIVLIFDYNNSKNEKSNISQKEILERNRYANGRNSLFVII